jgi:hypothetical protein
MSTTPNRCEPVCNTRDCPHPKAKPMSKLVLFLGPLAALLLYMVATAGPAYATFPGTNGVISFTRFVPATNGNEIFSIRADASDEQQLTFDPPGRTSLLQQGQGSTGLAYDLALVRSQIHEFESVAVARVTAHSSFNPDWVARNGH